MSYFLWGCRGILTLITLRSERVKLLFIIHKLVYQQISDRCCAFSPNILGKLPKNTISKTYTEIPNKRLPSLAVQNMLLPITEVHKALWLQVCEAVWSRFSFAININCCFTCCATIVINCNLLIPTYSTLPWTIQSNQRNWLMIRRGMSKFPFPLAEWLGKKKTQKHIKLWVKEKTGEQMSVQNDTISPLIIIFWQLFQKKIGNFWLQWVKFYLSQTSSFWFTFTLTCMGRTEYQTPAEGNENLYVILYNLLKCSTVPCCCLISLSISLLAWKWC